MPGSGLSSTLPGPAAAPPGVAMRSAVDHRSRPGSTRSVSHPATPMIGGNRFHHTSTTRGSGNDPADDPGGLCEYNAP